MGAGAATECDFIDVWVGLESGHVCSSGRRVSEGFFGPITAVYDMTIIQYGCIECTALQCNSSKIPGSLRLRLWWDNDIEGSCRQSMPAASHPCNGPIHDPIPYSERGHWTPEIQGCI